MKLSKAGTLILLALCQFLSGCATSALWKGEEYPVATEVVQAEVNQIYVSYDTSVDKGSMRYHWKYCIQYKVNKDNLLTAKRILFPEITDGYLIIKNKNSYTTAALLATENIQFIFNDTLTTNVTAYVEKYDKKIALSVAFTSQNISKFNKMTSDIQKLEHIPPFIINNYKYIYRNHQDKIGLNTNVNDTNSFFYNFYTDNISETEYSKDVNLTEWRPILNSSNINNPLSFYLFDSKKDYNNNLLTRLVITPFALVTDIATFPFQLAIAIGGPKN